MKKSKKTQTGLVAILLAVLLCMPLAAQAGTLEPTAPPGPTMHTLEEIYQKLEIVSIKMNLLGTNAGLNLYRYLDKGDGTVVDEKTGLIWLKSIYCMEYNNWTWDNATLWAAGLSGDGECGVYDGSSAGQWRLPTKDELQMLGTNPPITWESGLCPVYYGDLFPGGFSGAPSTPYWTSTENVANPEEAWAVDASTGTTYTYNKTGHINHIIAVRGGQ